MNQKVNTQVPAAPETEVSSEASAYEESIRVFAGACKAVREKKDRVYAAYEKARDAYFSGDSDRMKIPNSNPLDLAGVEDAVLKTGDPIEVKRYIGYARALAAPIFQDDDFYYTTTGVVASVCKYVAAEDDRLASEVSAAERDLEEGVKRLRERVAAARKRLDDHRCKITDKLVKPIMELDCLYVDRVPYAFAGEIGNRMLGILLGPSYPVRDVLQSILNQSKADRAKGKA